MKSTDYDYLKGRNSLNLLKLAEHCICHAFSSTDGSIFIYMYHLNNHCWVVETLVTILTTGEKLFPQS